MYFRTLFVTLFVLLISANVAQACQVMPLEGEDLEAHIEKTAFIGIVEVFHVELQQGKNDDFPGNKPHKVARIKPFMVYRSAPDFNLHDTVSLEFTHGLTSCDLNLEPYSYEEIVIYENADGILQLGNSRAVGSLHNAWDDLRSQVKYVGTSE